MEVPTIYKAYFSGLCKGISLENMANNMVQYLHFRILEFPLNKTSTGCWFGTLFTFPYGRSEVVIICPDEFPNSP